ncbi:hypothetical protein TNCV_1717231 [Trichonephila clavipes]|nr:hypothetical protein TNCV_1717231 [Trichonephila clavipes]
MKEGLIASSYECPKCNDQHDVTWSAIKTFFKIASHAEYMSLRSVKKDMRLVDRKGTIDCFEWRCRVQSKENPHFACRSTRDQSPKRAKCSRYITQLDVV